MPTPRGMRDFTPELMLLRREIFEKVEEVFQRFGFDPIETPILELFETVEGKYGEEAEKKLMYWFEDPWGGRKYALRYDLTVPLARFIADHRGIPLPFKRYHIGRVYRHDEPQRGRYREFWQCDIDTVGSSLPIADAEIIQALTKALEKLGFKGFVVRINDRRILRGIFEEKIGIKEEKIVQVYRIIDKLDKIGWGGVKKELKAILPSNKIREIEEVIDFRGSFDDAISHISSLVSSREAEQGLKHLEEIGNFVKAPLQFDLSLVRGLDYYTGVIFEFVLKTPRIGSIAGGGRYDELIGKISGIDLPAVGGSLGIERIIDAGIELGIFKIERKTSTEVYVVDIRAKKYAWEVAEMLREAGFNVRIDLTSRNWKKQVEYAKKLGIDRIVIVGEKEKKEKKAVVVKGERREEVELEVLPSYLKSL